MSFEGRRVGISKLDEEERKRGHAQVRQTQGCVGPGDLCEPVTV